MSLSISVDEYTDHIALASATSEYFTFRECYLDIMSRDAALMLQKMINRHAYFIRKKRQERWFPFPVLRMKKSLRMERDCQTRVLRELRGVVGKGKDGKDVVDKERVFVASERRGSPLRRHIRINYLALNRALAKFAEQTSMNGKSRRDANGKSRRDANGKSRRDILLKEREEEKTPCGEGGAAPSEHENSSSEQENPLSEPNAITGEALASLFFKEMTGKNRLLNHATRPREDAREFEMLVKEIRTRDNCTAPVAEAHVREAIKFHAEHYPDKYQPKIRSAKRFHNDFESIELAMKNHRLGKRKVHKSRDESGFSSDDDILPEDQRW